MVAHREARPVVCYSAVKDKKREQEQERNGDGAGRQYRADQFYCFPLPIMQSMLEIG
jgi:hypothetical protein